MASIPAGQKPVRVIIIGAGVSGLSAARCLIENGGLDPKRQLVILEARERCGGRVFTQTLPALPELALPSVAVDIGASVMHGCADENQSVFRMAVKDKIRAPVVAGGAFYECTEHARWFHKESEIPTRVISEMHALFFVISRYMAASASVNDDPAADMASHFEIAKEYVLRNLPPAGRKNTDIEESKHEEEKLGVKHSHRVLTPLEEQVLYKIRTRSFGYCAPMSQMAFHQAAAGGDPDEDAVIGPRAEMDLDLALPRTHELMSSKRIASEARALSRRLRSADNPKVSRATRRNLAGDRIVVDGYTPFLVNKLKSGLSIRYNSVVTRVEYCVSEKRAKTAVRPASLEAACDGVRVHTRDGSVVSGDYAVVTLPIGVLQVKSQESVVLFEPPLSEDKTRAIMSLGMGVHNKVILRFHPDEVFWPPGTPQLNCLDPRFQFLNLHAYGKPGVLLTHVFGGNEFASGYDGLTDSEVVEEVLKVLASMFFGEKSAIARLNRFETDSELQKSKMPSGSKRVRKGGIASVAECVEAEGSLCSMKKRAKHLPSCQSTSILSKRTRLCQGNSSLHGPMQNSKKSRLQESSSFARGKLAQVPTPLQSIVTRWDQDPFSRGSYSFLPVGADWDMISEMAVPEPKQSRNPMLFFAGEHCDDLGWQCVHGACESGKHAAEQIISCLDSRAQRLTTRQGGAAVGHASTSCTVQTKDVPDVARSATPCAGGDLEARIEKNIVSQVSRLSRSPAYIEDVLWLIAKRASVALRTTVTVQNVRSVIEAVAKRGPGPGREFLTFHLSGYAPRYESSGLAKGYLTPRVYRARNFSAFKCMIQTGISVARSPSSEGRPVVTRESVLNIMLRYMYEVHGHILPFRELEAYVFGAVGRELSSFTPSSKLEECRKELAAAISGLGGQRNGVRGDIECCQAVNNSVRSSPVRAPGSPNVCESVCHPSDSHSGNLAEESKSGTWRRENVYSKAYYHDQSVPMLVPGLDGVVCSTPPSRSWQLGDLLCSKEKTKCILLASSRRGPIVSKSADANTRGAEKLDGCGKYRQEMPTSDDVTVPKLCGRSTFPVERTAIHVQLDHGSVGKHLATDPGCATRWGTAGTRGVLPNNAQCIRDTVSPGRPAHPTVPRETAEATRKKRCRQGCCFPGLQPDDSCTSRDALKPANQGGVGSPECVSTVGEKVIAEPACTVEGKLTAEASRQIERDLCGNGEQPAQDACEVSHIIANSEGAEILQFGPPGRTARTKRRNEAVADAAAPDMRVSHRQNHRAELPAETHKRPRLRKAGRAGAHRKRRRRG